MKSYKAKENRSRKVQSLQQDEGKKKAVRQYKLHGVAERRG
jgi:hypothetical protein